MRIPVDPPAAGAAAAATRAGRAISRSRPTKTPEFTDRPTFPGETLYLAQQGEDQGYGLAMTLGTGPEGEASNRA